MKILLLIIIAMLFTTVHVDVQCRPVSLSDLKSWFATPDNAKESVFIKQGYSKGKMVNDPEFGITYIFLACWKQFADGYEHHEQNLTWIAEHRILNLTTLNADNYAKLRNEIKSATKYLGTDDQKVESYQDAVYGYSIQVVTTTEPMQKKHPSYVFLIYQALKN